MENFRTENNPNVFSPYKGKFKIDDNEKATVLFDFLNSQYKNNIVESFAEKQQDISGVMLDFDFFQTLPEPQIENKHIEKLVISIATVINKTFKFDEFDEYHIAVIRSPLVQGILRYSDRHKSYKDGIHILIPEEKITKEIKKHSQTDPNAQSC